MENKKVGQYYDAIMGDGKDSFRNYFEKKWNQFLDGFPTKHKNAAQLRIGNRLRPCLVCWGYALSTKDIDDMDFEKIVDLAIGMELIHKGSIIIDDYIDDDMARRGEITFHKEYSSNEAIMFLLFLLGKAVEQLAKYVKYERISHLICSMSEGALKELDLSCDDFFQAVKIDEIVKGETVSLIKDSLLFGYEVNNGDILEIGKILDSAVCKCAYSFQLLNDLEPFSAAEKNIQYKKNHNFDFEKNRKNLVITRLYEQCSEQDKCNIVSHLKSERLFDIIFDLMLKYKITNSVIQDVENSKLKINSELLALSPIINNMECLNDFLYFIDDTINLCYLRI